MSVDDALQALREQNAYLLNAARQANVAEKTRAIMRRRIEYNRACIADLIDERLGR